MHIHLDISATEQMKAVHNRAGIKMQPKWNSLEVHGKFYDYGNEIKNTFDMHISDITFAWKWFFFTGSYNQPTIKTKDHLTDYFKPKA